MPALKFLNQPLWGFSIALSWTWGLGLFFSVQMAIQFGLPGLLAFAIPNALGLMCFGLFAEHITRRHETGNDLERHFLRTVGNLRWVFLAYQIIAIALTMFALLKYVFLPLDIPLMPVAALVLGASLLLGEQFTIKTLKWSHLAMALIIGLSILLIGWGGASYFHAHGRIPQYAGGVETTASLRFVGYFIPILVGFLLGPWLDIQQWQRAIQIRREKTHIGGAYVFGGLVFFGILMFHGTLGMAIWGEGRSLGMASAALAPPTWDGLFHAKDAVVRFLFLSNVEAAGLFRIMYVAFLCLCIVATLDSGYVALKWFQRETANKSRSVLMSMLPDGVFSSPLPPFLLAAGIALVAIPLRFELEYFMAFYGSFAVGYAMVFLFRTVYEPRFTAFTQTTLVSLAFFSIGVFGLGYFENMWYMMSAGALVPLVHAIVCIMTRKAFEEIKKSGVMDRLNEGELRKMVDERLKRKPAPKDDEPPTGAAAGEGGGAAPHPGRVPVFVNGEPDLSPSVAMVAGSGSSSWIEDKWFVHSFTATYQDTNSVGNVYFAQYTLWVGKTRELFFNHVLPDFDLRTTPWFVLTRAFEHKFLRESREFEQIEVKIRISAVNRKFVTLEHQIFDSARQMLGKGKQSLLFVSSKDYGIVDIPGECQKAFLPYL